LDAEEVAKLKRRSAWTGQRKKTSFFTEQTRAREVAVKKKKKNWGGSGKVDMTVQVSRVTLSEMSFSLRIALEAWKVYQVGPKKSKKTLKKNPH
jgi:hypothetical protein